MMQTLREEAATHTIKIYQERIGIIESILANSYNTGITRCFYLDIIVYLIFSQDKFRIPLSYCIRNRLQSLIQTISIFLCPCFSFIRENNMIVLIKHTDTRHIRRHNLLAQKFYFRTLVDGSGSSVTRKATILLPGMSPGIRICIHLGNSQGLRNHRFYASIFIHDDG